jgi:hypothetical protein
LRGVLDLNMFEVFSRRSCSHVLVGISGEFLQGLPENFLGEFDAILTAVFGELQSDFVAGV